MERRNNGTPQAATLGGLGGSGVTLDGKARSRCGRCGVMVSERVNNRVRYCRDCKATDPLFCSRS